MGRQPKQSRAEEGEILNLATDLLRVNTGLELVITEQEPVDRADAYGHINFKGGNIPVCVEVKRHATNMAAGAIAQQIERFPGRGILVADYVNPAMAETLKALDVWYLDTVGNAYINHAPIYIYVKGNRPNKPIGKVTKKRAFQPTGLKIIFALLCQPKLVNAPYRDIAKIANVALGTVGWVITDLKELGFLMEVGKKNRKITQIEKLFERWVEAYPDQLRPKQLIGRYTTKDTLWWKEAKLRKFDVFFGGEIAADYLTHYLKPEKQILYIRGEPKAFQFAYKLREDPKGRIELLETFWSKECDWVDNEIVHPILVYADLLATGDPRNIETAKIIYEKNIAGHFREA